MRFVNNDRLRRSLAYAAAAGMLVAAAVGLTQCKKVADTPTDVRTYGPGSCLSQCAQDNATAHQAEAARHALAVKACAGNAECLRLEQSRYQAALDRIQAAHKNCQDACHKQGGGGGR